MRLLILTLVLVLLTPSFAISADWQGLPQVRPDVQKKMKQTYAYGEIVKKHSSQKDLNTIKNLYLMSSRVAQLSQSDKPTRERALDFSNKTNLIIGCAGTLYDSKGISLTVAAFNNTIDSEERKQKEVELSKMVGDNNSSFTGLTKDQCLKLINDN